MSDPHLSNQPLCSVHTSNLPELLDSLGISLMVSTYQAGKLVLLRSENGVLNTHFRVFDKPMGLAVERNRFAIGTAMQIWEFHNIPAVCARLNEPEKYPLPKGDEVFTTQCSKPPRPHDAVFLPRVAHWTGDIDIHEMAWVDDDLVFINTRFSCLARRSGVYNFETVLATTLCHSIHTWRLLPSQWTRNPGWSCALRHGFRRRS